MFNVQPIVLQMLSPCIDAFIENSFRKYVFAYVFMLIIVIFTRDSSARRAKRALAIS